MTPRDRRRLGFRARVLLGVALLALSAVGARVSYLQVTRHEELSRLSRDEYLSDVQIPARRGHIYDRHGKSLAISVDVPSVYANPSEITDPRAAAHKLSPVLGMKLDTIYQRLARDRLFVWLKRQVTPAIAEQVTALGIGGVRITKESRRYYPNREVGAHVIGFCGVDVHGLEGIERQLDAVLAGAPQVVPALRDARGNAVLQADADPDRHSAGADVYLTLDLRIQHAAQQTLAHAVERTKARGAMAVVLEVPTSEILTLAVEPVFNPNQATDVSAEVRRNRTVTDMFEPGSALKPMVMAGALEAKVVSTRSQLFCENGAYEIGTHTIHDSKPHGWLTPALIIAKSSNICAAKIGEAFGSQGLWRALRSFGLGEKTGVAFPGETGGMLRDPATWSKVGTATISFGQGVAVSALQLAAAYRILATGGRYRRPALIASVEGSGGRRHRRGARDQRVLSQATAESVTRMLERAASAAGTGFRARVPGYRVAGKTGTAQKVDPVAGGYSSDRFVAVFAGFLPAQDPRVVIVVAVDEPQTAHSGGTVAAPIFAEIGEAAMRYLGVVPSERLTRPESPRAVAEEPVVALAPAAGDSWSLAPDRVPSYLGLTARQVLARYSDSKMAFDLELQGSGRVVRQSPQPGAERRSVRRVTLVLAGP